MKRLNAKKLTGNAAKFLAAVVVLAFLGLHSINFFMFVFPVDQQYYAWLGFGLTGGGFVAYLAVFLWEADTVLKKWSSLAIALISGAGEILTAIFGMEVEAWAKSGWALTEEDFQYMLLAVGLLGIAHALALTAYMAGDKIIELFGDEDGDGTPNYRDRDYRPRPVYAQTTTNMPQVQQTSYTMADLARVSGKTVGQMRAEFPDYERFAAWCSGQFDSVSGKNMRKIFHGELNRGNPQNGDGRK